eukprot:CAMPEP_0115866318 /NCGR_PEP_ID=MMETSP0287-20121206/20186_1 /TAXON_ID=412157 /ORGANISM="Chrysochromulina rotalis, Strain UIO044" /LENGTH=151 /DNA_ID=CAMNT_0003320879 /DNA_START=31 /DNA_END=486 /DNA_ORIENTATION=-
MNAPKLPQNREEAAALLIEELRREIAQYTEACASMKMQLHRGQALALPLPVLPRPPSPSTKDEASCRETLAKLDGMDAMATAIISHHADGAAAAAFSSLIETLTQAHCTKVGPREGYIDVSGFDEGHVEVLIEAGVAERHQTNDQLVCLLP